MIHKVKITKVFISDKDKTGKAFVTKAGKPFKKVGIQTDKFGDEWYSTLAFNEDDRVLDLNEGDEVTIMIEKNGNFNNFKLPSRLDLLELRVEALEKKAQGVSDTVIEPDGLPEVDSADLPF